MQLDCPSCSQRVVVDDAKAPDRPFAVKCPKCNYLGFETGDRCKNCGYDFSLMNDPDPSIDLDFEIALRASDDTLPASVPWDDQFNHMDADALADAAALAESLRIPASRRSCIDGQDLRRRDDQGQGRAGR